MTILNTIRNKLGLSSFPGAGATDILAAIKKEMHKRQKILLNSIRVPDSFQVELGSVDFAAIKPFQEIFCRELTQAVMEHVTTRNYSINTEIVRVGLCCNPKLPEGTIAVSPTFSTAVDIAQKRAEKTKDNVAVNLVVAMDTSHEETRVLGPGTYLIGRGRDADIFPLVEDMLMSRSHCLLTIDADTILIQDLESGNGVQVNNGEPVIHANLQRGDCFLCGNTTFSIQS